MSGPVVVHRPLTDVSPIDELAGRCIGLMLCAAQVPNVALRALIRLASEELARMDGHEAVAEFHAKLVHRNHERQISTLRPQRVRR